LLNQHIRQLLLQSAGIRDARFNLIAQRHQFIDCRHVVVQRKLFAGHARRVIP
jgi:hypothetical protein